MTDLVAFLRGRLDDEALFAREAHHQQWLSEEGYVESPTGSHVARFEFDSDARHAGCWDPSRVLAEVAAKRAILDLCVLPPEVDADGTLHVPGGGGYGEAWLDALLALARVYADHPDFDPAWTEEAL